MRQHDDCAQDETVWQQRKFSPASRIVEEPLGEPVQEKVHPSVYGKKESVPRKVEQAEITEMHVSWKSKLKEAHPRRYVNAHECTELKRSSFSRVPPETMTLKVWRQKSASVNRNMKVSMNMSFEHDIIILQDHEW